MIKTMIATALIATGLMLTPAQANGVKLGTLTCQIEGGAGLLIGSVRKGECTYNATNGKSKHYTATFSRLGVDVGAVLKGGGDEGLKTSVRHNNPGSVGKLCGL